MPFCGFDKQMLDGLEMFHQGLADSIIRRSGEEGLTVEKAIQTELEEMKVFVKELQRTGNYAQLTGLAHYAQAYYDGALQRIQDGSSTPEAMKIESTTIRGFLFEVDRRYYEDLKGKVPEPIKELVKWIALKGGKNNATKRI